MEDAVTRAANTRADYEGFMARQRTLEEQTESKEHDMPPLEVKESGGASTVDFAGLFGVDPSWVSIKKEPIDPGIVVSSMLDVKLMAHVGSDDSVVAAAKVSTAGVDSMDFWERNIKTSNEGLLRYLMKNRHGSPFEHNSFTFFVQAPIAVFREFMRHRIGFSYNEESGRYKQLEPRFYLPDARRPIVQQGKPGHYEYVAGSDEQYVQMFDLMKSSFQLSYVTYQELLDLGIAREVARGVLPVYIYSSMYVTCNARSLMHFLSLRTKDGGSTFPSFPMWEIEQVARQMERLWQEQMPITQSLFREFGSVAP